MSKRPIGEHAVVLGAGAAGNLPAAASEVGAARPPQRPRAEAMRHLPGAYSLALRLRDAGLDDDLIAECLAIERESLEPLLKVAEAKLAALLTPEPT